MDRTIKAAFLLLLGLSACSDPCMDLAKKICSCEPDMLHQQSCDLRVEEQGKKRKPTEQQTAVCADLIDECTCEKLAAGDYQACGLAP